MTVNLMDIAVYETLTPGVIALVSQGDKFVQVLYTKSVIKLLARITDELTTNCYGNREIQEKYNKGELELLLLEKVDLSGVESPVIQDLILRHKAKLNTDVLLVDGYNVASVYNPVNMKVEAVFPHARRGGPQVELRIARGKRYYVQQFFPLMGDAEAYIKNTDLIQILKDTGGCQVMFKKPVVPVD